MGIPPYMSPPELEKMREHIAHRDQFVKDRGFKNCLTVNPNAPWVYLPRKEYKGPDGLVYSKEGYWEEFRCYPCHERDGICYGYAYPDTEGYVDPYVDECNFIEGKGYVRSQEFADDYMENNRLMEVYYKEHGFCPRWEKDGKMYGHYQILEDEDYKYLHTWEKYDPTKSS